MDLFYFAIHIVNISFNNMFAIINLKKIKQLCYEDLISIFTFENIQSPD